MRLSAERFTCSLHHPIPTHCGVRNIHRAATITSTSAVSSVTFSCSSSPSLSSSSSSSSSSAVSTGRYAFWPGIASQSGVCGHRKALAPPPLPFGVIGRWYCALGPRQQSPLPFPTRHRDPARARARARSETAPRHALKLRASHDSLGTSFGALSRPLRTITMSSTTPSSSSSPQAMPAAARTPEGEPIESSAAASSSASMLPSIPDLLYGTAWKDTRTTSLVFTAITAGFRGIDTAGQRKHYREELVGRALDQVEEAGVARREEIWLQTKFTSTDGQDLSGPVPYDPRWPVRKQIRHSAFASLRNLHVSDRWDKAELLEAAKQAAGLTRSSSAASGSQKGKGRSLDVAQKASASLDDESEVPNEAVLSSEHAEASASPSGLPDFARFRPIGAISADGKTRPWLDSYLLHSPLRSLEETLQAWQEMELLVQEGWVRHIGFSNVYDSRIWNALLQSINIRPLALQNRWHGSSGHDVSLLSTLSPILSPNDSAGRAIHYQPFWTLTGNPALLRSEPVVRAAIAHDWTPAQVVYKFVQQGLGIQGLRCCVLTGTTDEKHMRQAVQVVYRNEEAHRLTPSEVNEIRKQVYGE